MHFDWSTFALQAVNFGILVWLLQRFLYRPVLRVVDARQADIDRQFAAARATESKASDHLAAIEGERAGIAAERAAVLTEAVAQAEEVAAGRRAQAEHDAAALLDAARTALAAERSEALAEAKEAALDLGAQIAGRLLAELPAQPRSEVWLERIHSYLASLPQSERDTLGGQLVAGAGLEVVTASPLPAEITEIWRGQLRRIFGDHAAVGFDVDEHLLAGVELHFPDTVLRFSWQSSLEGIRAEMAGRGNAR
jgi:F-type H+-transporting ATPase subunit b